jgi:putative transposase
MTTPRKQYSPTFKSQVVQEVLEGNNTLAQIAARHGIHPNVIAKWKRAALTALPDTFDERAQRQISTLIEQHEKEKERLYAEIGRLTTELRWLEKKSEAGFAQSAQAGFNRTRKRSG